MEINDIRQFSLLTFAIPDIMVGLSLIIFSILRIFLEERHLKIVLPKLSIVLSLTCLVTTMFYNSFNEEFSNSLFIYDYNLSHIKTILLLIISLIFITMYMFKEYKKYDGFIYCFIFSIASALMICLSSNNFLSLVLGLELYSFSVCFLLMLMKNNLEGKKNAVRFLITSAFMSAILFFGMSLYYSQFESLSFFKIAPDDSFSSIVGTMLIASGILFKIGAFPFHSWIVDIYEKASIKLILFFEVVWKFFAIFILIRVFNVFISGESHQILLYLKIIAIINLIVGAILPIWQSNIKRFIAYSTIGHIGVILSMFSVCSEIKELTSVIMYVLAYNISILIFIASLLQYKKHYKVETFYDLSGKIQDSRVIGYSFILSMISLAGAPPFISFIAKFSIIQKLLNLKEYGILIILILYSISAFYYCVKWGKLLFKEKALKTDSQETCITSKVVYRILIVILILSPLIYNQIYSWFYDLLSRIL